MRFTANQLERYRSYLVLLARVHFDARLRGKVDPEDIAQQALIQAYASAGELIGDDEATIFAWLRRVLANTLIDAIRHYTAEKRDVQREHALGADLEQSSQQLGAWIAGSQTSPSKAAAKQELFAQVADAINVLPEPMREIIILKHLRGMGISEISNRTGKSLASVASYLRRGLEMLRHLLQEQRPTSEE